MEGRFPKTALFFLILIALFALFLNSFELSYENKSDENKALIGKRIRVQEDIVAVDTFNAPKGVSDVTSCPTRWNHFRLAGHFFQNRTEFLDFLLNKSDPSLSKEKCTIVKVFECAPGVLGSAFGSTLEGYIVDCNGTHISLLKMDAIVVDE